MGIELSVVIPAYNCLEYLPTCLDSVLSQRYSQLEIIVVDDGSTDGSRAWLSEKSKICPQLRVLTQQNEGVVNARNRAIKEAKGDFIAFLDADDIWYANKLKTQMDYMNTHKGCVLSFTNYDHVDENKHFIVDCFSYWKPSYLSFISMNYFVGMDDPLNCLLKNNIVGTSTVIVSRKAMLKAGLFDPTLNSASDWDMWLKLSRLGCFAYSHVPMMGYLMRSGSITSNRLNRLHAMEMIVNRVTKLANPVSINQAKANIQEGYAEFNREQQLYITAIKHDIKSLWLVPHLRTFKHLCSDIKHMIINKERFQWNV